MAAHISRIVEKLIFAIRAVNEIIVRGEAVSSVRKKEVLRDLCTALRRVVNHHALWEALYESAGGASSIADIPETEKFLELFSDILGDAHAKFLIECGYRSPPPPRAYELTKQTIDSVRSVHREPRWDTAHIEHAREALTNFVDNIVKHINDANPRRLNRIRQGAIGAAFMALCSQAEIKTGDGFSVQLGASLTDPIAIEITVPAPWAIGALTESMDAIAAITSVDSLTEIAALPFDVAAPWEAVEDPAAAVEHPAEDPAPRRTFDPFDDPF